MRKKGTNAPAGGSFKLSLRCISIYLPTVVALLAVAQLIFVINCNVLPSDYVSASLARDSPESLKRELPRDVFRDLVHIGNEANSVNTNIDMKFDAGAPITPFDGKGSNAYISEYAYADSIPEAWLGNTPIAVTSDTMKAIGKRKKYRLVISHCDKPLHWIYDRFIRTRWDQAKIQSITIYSKCGNPIVGAPDHPNLKVIILPNVGRCDHSYAHWMATDFQTINGRQDKETVVMFIKDNGYQLNSWRPFISSISLAYVNGFSCAHDVDNVNGKNHQYSIYHNYEKMKPFTKEFHVREGKKLTDEDRELQEGFRSPYESFGAYVESLKLPIPQPFLPVCYGGAFTVTMESIRKVPQETWQSIKDSLSRRDNVEEGHFIERLWAALLMKPLSEEGIRAISETSDGAECVIPETRNDYVKGYDQYSYDHCGIMYYKVNTPPIRPQPVLSNNHRRNQFSWFESLKDGWTGNAPIPVTSDTMKTLGLRKKYRLVVSHCDKSLEWIFQDFIKTRWDAAKIQSITVYSKCGQPVEWSPPNNEIVTIINLPNTGRSDHSFAHWMAYESQKITTTNNDEFVVMFIQDDEVQQQRWRPFIAMISLAYVNGFSCSVNVKSMANDRYSLYHRHDVLRTYTKEVDFRHGRFWSQSELDGIDNFRSPYKTLGNFIDALALPINGAIPYVPVCYGGSFTVSMDRIQAVPADVWQRIEKSLARGENIEEISFAERVWAALLAKPLHPATIRRISELSPNFRCKDLAEGLEDKYFSYEHCGIMYLSHRMMSTF